MASTPTGESWRTAARSALTIAVAPPKGDRLEWLVAKCTGGRDRPHRPARGRALGRALAEDRAARQLDRLRRVAVEASMQSRRVWLPEIAGPITGDRGAARRAAAEPGGRAG